MKFPAGFMVAALVLGGCADNVKHELNVSQELRRMPIRSVVILLPAFNKKVKRVRPDDFFHMKPDRQPAAGTQVRDALTAAFSASLSVDAGFVPDEATRDWAADIGEDLARGRVPLSVDPHPLAAEAVLLTGVQLFGWEHDEVQLQILWFKRKSFGPPRITHNVRLQAVLVNPRTGDVLLDALEGVSETVGQEDEALLDHLLRTVADRFAAALPPPPGGPTPRTSPAAAPLPTAAPSGTSL